MCYIIRVNEKKCGDYVKLLIAEPNRDFTATFTPLLEYSGYEVTAVFDGTQVLMKMEAEDFDLVLLDDEIPRVAAVTLIQQLRQKGIPVIVITNHRLTSTVLSQPVIGNAYLPLPFLPQDLLSLMERVMTKKRSQEILRFEDIEINVSDFMLCGQLMLTSGEIDIVQSILTNRQPGETRPGSHITAFNRKLTALHKKPRIRYMINEGYRMVT